MIRNGSHKKLWIKSKEKNAKSDDQYKSVVEQKVVLSTSYVSQYKSFFQQGQNNNAIPIHYRN